MAKMTVDQLAELLWTGRSKISYRGMQGIVNYTEKVNEFAELLRAKIDSKELWEIMADLHLRALGLKNIPKLFRNPAYGAIRFLVEHEHDTSMIKGGLPDELKEYGYLKDQKDFEAKVKALEKQARYMSHNHMYGLEFEAITYKWPPGVLIKPYAERLFGLMIEHGKLRFSGTNKKEFFQQLNKYHFTPQLVLFPWVNEEIGKGLSWVDQIRYASDALKNFEVCGHKPDSYMATVWEALFLMFSSMKLSPEMHPVHSYYRVRYGLNNPAILYFEKDGTAEVYVGDIGKEGERNVSVMPLIVIKSSYTQ